MNTDKFNLSNTTSSLGKEMSSPGYTWTMIQLKIRNLNAFLRSQSSALSLKEILGSRIA